MRRTSLFGLTGLVCVLSGCAYNLRGSETENAELREQNKSVLECYFTREAAVALEEIPVHYGVFDVAWAKGLAHTSKWEAMWVGHGYSPVTVYNVLHKRRISHEVFIHENTHQAEALKLVDRNEFEKAWGEMRKEQQGHYLCMAINTEIDRKYGGVITKKDELVDEQIAYMTQYILKYPSAIPDCMRSVYRKLLHPWVLSDGPSLDEKNKR